MDSPSQFPLWCSSLRHLPSCPALPLDVEFGPLGPEGPRDVAWVHYLVACVRTSHSVKYDPNIPISCWSRYPIGTLEYYEDRRHARWHVENRVLLDLAKEHCPDPPIFEGDRDFRTQQLAIVAHVRAMRDYDLAIDIVKVLAHQLQDFLLSLHFHALMPYHGDVDQDNVGNDDYFSADEDYE